MWPIFEKWLTWLIQNPVLEFHVWLFGVRNQKFAAWEWGLRSRRNKELSSFVRQLGYPPLSIFDKFHNYTSYVFVGNYSLDRVNKHISWRKQYLSLESFISTDSSLFSSSASNFTLTSSISVGTWTPAALGCARSWYALADTSCLWSFDYIHFA